MTIHTCMFHFVSNHLQKKGNRHVLCPLYGPDVAHIWIFLELKKKRLRDNFHCIKAELKVLTKNALDRVLQSRIKQ
jgi:hypothetical protein